MSDEVKCPDYINKEFFEKCLRSGLKSTSITITDIKITMGSKSGDNYCSDIYRATIVYTNAGKRDNKVSLIVKAMPYDEARGPLIENLEVFDKEVQMYMETIPKMSALLNNEYMCAKCFYASKEPVQIIVFEDLKSLGYDMADRQAGIDERHCNLVLNKLGRFHAASMVIADKEARSMDNYSFGMIKPNAKIEIIEAVFVKGLETFIEVVKSWPGYESIVKKMQALLPDFSKKMDRHSNQTPATFKVLNHGDLWVNNFLFKYKDGIPTDVVFVDYQMSFYSSPGHDINYFISTSPRNDIREQKRELLIETYYNSFAKTLSALGSKHMLSLDAVKKEISRREFYGFSASIGLTPLIMISSEASKDSSLENLQDEDASAKLRFAMYSSPNYQRAMKFMLKRFDDLKVLENNY